MLKTSAAFIVLCLFTITAAALPAHSGDINHWLNQIIYVPLYSHIYADDRYKDKPFALTATLSIRNTDLKFGLVLDAVDYYDSAGKILRSYLKKPDLVSALASRRFVVKESDTAGGSGAKFIIRWHAEKPVTQPIVESIMIGTQMQQGISFISPGRVIDGSISR